VTNAHDLTKRLAELLRNERSALAEFLIALASFHRDERWRELGYTSLFYFLRRELGLSATAAQQRKTAVELVLDFPDLIEPLRGGLLCLSTVCDVRKVLTPENWKEILPRFLGLSHREAEALVAELQPVAVVPRREVVTIIRAPACLTPAVAPASSAAAAGPAQPELHGEVVPTSVFVTEIKTEPAPACPPTAAPLRPRDAAVPLTADLRRVHYTVSKRFLDKLDRARDALSHSNPGSSVEEILEKGLDLILQRQAKRRGLVEKPRSKLPAAPPPLGSRCASAAVRRAVFERDGGRCQWPMASGGVCGSTYQVELDHVRARALGGRATVDEMRCLCKCHNDEAARQAFGDEWMDRFTRRRRRRRGSAASAREPVARYGCACRDASPPPA